MAARSSASGWGDIQRIVCADVAQTAGHAGVRVGQRESGGIVIKNPRRPGSDRMAGRTRCCCRREASRHMVRNRSTNRRGAEEGRLMAAVTIRRVKRVIVIHMAGRARGRRRRHVRSGQRKPGNAVIECRRRPARRGMASCAVRCGKGGA